MSMATKLQAWVSKPPACRASHLDLFHRDIRPSQVLQRLHQEDKLFIWEPGTNCKLTKKWLACTCLGRQHNCAFQRHYIVLMGPVSVQTNNEEANDNTWELMFLLILGLLFGLWLISWRGRSRNQRATRSIVTSLYFYVRFDHYGPTCSHHVF